MKTSIARVAVIGCGALCLFPSVESAWALAAGVVLALTLGNPYRTGVLVHPLLACAVAGLGAGMNLVTIAHVGLQGLGTTFVSILSVCAVGFVLTKLLRVDEPTGALISIGTAICGGSAIAAVTPILRAKPQAVSVALGTVFVLNALALITFPPVGHLLGMSERAFGLWSALAIHDTSSVVGATVAYGKTAAEVGTTIKLARALWIIPVTLCCSVLFRAQTGDAKIKTRKPWFIAWFVLLAAVVTFYPPLRPLGHRVEFVARRLMVLTLFLIGLGLSKDTIKSVGPRPFTMGVLLWVLTSGVSLLVIQAGLIAVGS